MRLIDAADAFTVLTEYYHHRTDEMHNSLREALDRVPTIDPVKHSKWIWDDEGYHCSECWYHAYGNVGEVMSGEYRYCPHCGAQMERSEE